MEKIRKKSFSDVSSPSESESEISFAQISCIQAQWNLRPLVVRDCTSSWSELEYSNILSSSQLDLGLRQHYVRTPTIGGRARWPSGQIFAKKSAYAGFYRDKISKFFLKAKFLVRAKIVSYSDARWMSELFLTLTKNMVVVAQLYNSWFTYFVRLRIRNSDIFFPLS